MAKSARNMGTVAFRVHVLRGLNASRAKDPRSEETKGWEVLLAEEDRQAFSAQRALAGRYVHRVTLCWLE
jgi:hypothetical protein